MSSREIAELCEKEHRNVLRDIDNLNETYEKIPLPEVGQGYYTAPNTGNQQHREYLLTKEHRNVCRDIENLNLEYGKLSLPNFEQCERTPRIFGGS